MRKALVLPLLLLLLPPVDWEKERSEILQRHRDLVQINTVYGNETKVVDYLKKVLDEEGIPYKIFAKDPNRENLVARLKGSGSKRPLLIFAHTDVVAVQPEKWRVDPFSAVQRLLHRCRRTAESRNGRAGAAGPPGSDCPTRSPA